MNGDFDLFVLNGKMKELGEKISSINNYIGNLQLGLDSLNIGRPDDMGGTQTTGTVMAKENEIMGMILAASNKQIWGKWVSIAVKGLSVNLVAGETKTEKVVIPANTWFNHIYVGKSVSGTDVGANIATKIGKISFSTPTRNTAGSIGWYYAYTYMGMQSIINMTELARHNSTVATSSPSINTNYETISLFPYFEEDTEVEVTMRNISSEKEIKIDWRLYYFAEVKLV